MAGGAPKLTADKVVAMRNARKREYIPARVLAAHFGVDEASIRSALAGRTWRSVNRRERPLDLQKGRCRGERNPHASLTEAQVREIRRLWWGVGLSGGALARRFGVGRAAIGKIVRRENWAHIDG